MENEHFFNLDLLVSAIILEAVNDIARYNRYLRHSGNSRIRRRTSLKGKYQSAKEFMLSDYGCALTNVDLKTLYENIKDSEHVVNFDDLGLRGRNRFDSEPDGYSI